MRRNALPAFPPNCKLDNPAGSHNFSATSYIGTVGGDNSYPGPLRCEMRNCERCNSWEATYTTENGDWSHTLRVSFTKGNAERVVVTSPNGIDRNDWQEGEVGQ